VRRLQGTERCRRLRWYHWVDESIELAAAKYQLGRQTGEALRDLGVALLSSGHDQAVRLAIVDDLTMAEVGPIFERVCREMGQAIPPLDQAIDIVLAAQLTDIAEGRVAPEVGLKHLMDDVVVPHVTAESQAGPYRFAGESRDLQHLVGARWSYDEFRARPTELSIDGKFGDEAIKLLDNQVVGFARDWLHRHAATS
jgi:hypothetical protein